MLASYNVKWFKESLNSSESMPLVLMQTNGKSIYLLPAWPDEWDVDFKLHAPFQTTIEGSYENGKLAIIEVIPKERLKDIVNMKE